MGCVEQRPTRSRRPSRRPRPSGLRCTRSSTLSRTSHRPPRARSAPRKHRSAASPAHSPFCLLLGSRLTGCACHSRQVIQMERQLAGMRFDAETRIHELEQRATSAVQSEAVAIAKSREAENSLDQLRKQLDDLSTQKRRVDEALRSVLGINESLLGRISSVDGPRAALPMPTYQQSELASMRSAPRTRR